jgi:hypothetical protein
MDFPRLYHRLRHLRLLPVQVSLIIANGLSMAPHVGCLAPSRAKEQRVV